MRIDVAACALTALLVIGCDPAKEDYERCSALEAQDPEAALVACESAIEKSADSDSGKAATVKAAALNVTVAALQKQEAEEAEQARIAAAEADLARLKAVPIGMNKKIRKQAMWDMGRGVATPVINMITAEAGQPVRTYETAFGAQLFYVWGGDPGSEASMETIKNGPLSARMPRGLSCADYMESMVEFYSEGQRLRP